MTKAFGYIRVSGAAQIHGDGPERQRLAITAYAAQHGLEIVEWFEELGVSGVTEWEDRPAWSDMIGRLNGVRTIIVEKLDRLARELMVQEYILKDLTKRDVTLLSTAEESAHSSDPTRILFRQMIGAIAQYEKTMLVRKMKAAKDRIRARGERCEGRKPYGVDESERTIIADIKWQRQHGSSYERIAEGLNDRKIPTRAGKTWHAGTVQRIFGRVK